MKSKTQHTFLIIVLLLFSSFKALSFSNINVQWHVGNNQVEAPVNTAPIDINGPLRLIATITSPTTESFEIHTLLWEITTSRPYLFSGVPKLWITNNPSFTSSSLAPTATGNGVFAHSGNIAPISTNPNFGTYRVYMQFNSTVDLANCQWINFSIRTYFGGLIAPQYESHNSSSRLYLSHHVSNLTEWNTPDLFVRDNKRDVGIEPNWQINNAEITKSVSIVNKLNGTVTRNSIGLNPNMLLPNYAQRSTLGNYNTMNVWVENRGCVATTAPANLNIYWTVARLWETWGRDWHNHNVYPWSSSNFTNYFDPNTGLTTPVPLGNHITLADKDDYESAVQAINMPAGLQPTGRDANSGDYTGGHLASVQWNAPDALWYTGASTILRNAGRPALCYLAVIEEPNKAQNGFFQSFTTGSNVSILDFALKNNNVATVNSYLATPSGLYKTAKPGNRFGSDPGVIRIDNPRNLPTVPISIIADPIGTIGDPDQSYTPIFADNGTVYAIFDEVLWAAWAAADYQGSGFEIVAEQVIKITNLSLATINGISLGENEAGMLGIQFEYNGENTPAADYDFHLSVGTYDTENPTVQIGTPTHFSTHVLKTPQVEEAAPLYKTGLQQASPSIAQIDFLNMYPNPATDKLNITFELKQNADLISLEVYDLQLKLVKKISQQQNIKGAKTFAIPTDDLPNGNYILKLNIDNSYQTLKFVK